MEGGKARGVAILGGSFNPPHFGHLRLALEVFEAVKPARLDFVPGARPPHKAENRLLPFDWRCAMLSEALRARPYFAVNRLEESLPGPSFTCALLSAYKEQNPGTALWFILGSGDFAGLESWKEWRGLPRLANLVVAARQGDDQGAFLRAAGRLWPTALPAPVAENTPVAEGAGALLLDIPGGGQVLYLPVPRLDITSSLLRERWLAGRAVDFWTPEAVLDFLRDRADLVRARWTAS